MKKLTIPSEPFLPYDSFVGGENNALISCIKLSLCCELVSPDDISKTYQPKVEFRQGETINVSKPLWQIFIDVLSRQIRKEDMLKYP